MINETNRRRIGACLGVLISLVLLAFFINYIDFAVAVKLVTESHIAYLLLAVFFLALGYALRIHRWRTMLVFGGNRLGFINVADAFMKSIAMNNLLPLRAGDIYRLTSFPKSGIKRSEIAVTVVFERLLDLVAIAVLLLVSSVFLGEDFLSQEIKSAVYFLIVPIVLMLFIPFLLPYIGRAADGYLKNNTQSGSVRWCAEKLSEIINILLGLYAPANIFLLMLLSIFCWLFEGGVYYFVAEALDLTFSIYIGIAALCIGTLSTLIPSSPGYVGTFHVAITLFLVNLNLDIDDASAGAYAFLVHFVLWGSTTLVGLLFFVKLKKH